MRVSYGADAFEEGFGSFRGGRDVVYETKAELSLCCELAGAGYGNEAEGTNNLSQYLFHIRHIAHRWLGSDRSGKVMSPGVGISTVLRSLPVCLLDQTISTTEYRIVSAFCQDALGDGNLMSVSN